MGSLSLPFYKKIVGPLLLLLTLSLGAKEIEGVILTDAMTCEGKQLSLSGAGLRTATFLKVKVFVLGVYAEKKILQGKGSELDQRPLCFSITYLRDFDNEDVDKAWDYQFKESSQHQYPEFQNDVASVKKFFGEIKGAKNQMFALLPDRTLAYENGELKGEIKGTDFQKSFLSIWFGKNPPTKELQRSLLNEAK